MAADHQKRVRLQWESVPRETIDSLVEQHKLKRPWPEMRFPDDLLESENGVGVYHNPDEGVEIMTGFNNLISGLKKKGADLSEDEEDAIRSFIRSNSVSPRFVMRLTGEHGVESVEAAFLIRTNCEESLNYLLRRYKGAYYRTRYSRIALV